MPRSILWRSSALASLILLLAGLPFLAEKGHAGVTGVLKLKVKSCWSVGWLSDARIDVVIWRTGVGQVDSATDYTDNDGYLEIAFDDLEDEDKALVTVTPSGQSPDDDHTYYWILSQGYREGYWDLGTQGDSGCEDGWYSEKENVILCVYH